MLVVSVYAYSQAPGDSTFSILINSGVGFTHANDPHINRWLAKYGYPTEPHVPSSINFEIAATPVASSLMYSIKLSSINSGHNLSSFNLMAGLYNALVKSRSFLLYVGAGVGYHSDIITLNGELPSDYRLLADQVNKQLSLHRIGLIFEPAARAFWFPISCHQVQLGLFAGLGFDMDFNTAWRLGYYDNNHGVYGRFKKLKKPADQQRVSEYGLAYNLGLSLRINLR